MPGIRPPANAARRRPRPRLRERPHCAVRQQGRRQGPQGQGVGNQVPPQEEPAVLRHFCQVKLQLREALPLARPQAVRKLGAGKVPPPHSPGSRWWAGYISSGADGKRRNSRPTSPLLRPRLSSPPRWPSSSTRTWTTRRRSPSWTTTTMTCEGAVVHAGGPRQQGWVGWVVACRVWHLSRGRKRGKWARLGSHAGEQTSLADLRAGPRYIVAFLSS